MIFIRSLLFNIFISIWGMIIPIIYCSVFITNNSRVADQGAKNWSKFIVWILEKMLDITYQVKGLEHLPKQGGFIVACKHQSIWETFIMHLIFNQPVYVYKKELLRIPFYGWYLNKMSGIKINRQGGGAALKSLLTQAKKYLNNSQVIIIFPQGTRTAVGATTQEYPYQSGILALYNSLNAPVIPATLDSGFYWNKKGLTGKTGKITLEFLPAINPGLDKNQFMTTLENQIETRTNQLYQTLNLEKINEQEKI